MWGGILRDHQDRETKKAGLVEQGPKLVTPEEFNHIYQGDGIGLEVKSKSTSGTLRIRIPKTYEPQSVVVLGDTGAGKTVALKQMIDQIEERGDLAVIHDPKANYLSSYFNSNRGDVVLNPFDVRSPFWTPTDEALNLPDIETVANAFFPDVPGKDAFWTESPRKLMTIFLSKGLSAADMVRLFESDNQIDKIVAGSKYASLIDPKSPSQRSGVLSELTKLAQVLQWLPAEEDTKSRWSAARWTVDPRGWLFLTSRADQSTALQTLYAIWLELLITRCLAKRFSKRLWFVIDELPVLRHIPNLQKLITLGRECNVPLILGLQGRAQLDERYGQNGTEVILSQPVTKIFLRTSEPKAAKWISDSIGSQALERVREGVTAGVQDWRDSVNYTPDRRIEPAVLDSVIASLPNLRGYLKFLEHIVEIQYEPKDRPNRTEAMILRPPQPLQDFSKPRSIALAPEPVIVNAQEDQKSSQPKLRLLG
jgi:type IV secretory pathway TraG/TraD family ATPase VirD4